MKSIRNRVYNLTLIAVIFLFLIFSVTAFVSIFKKHTVYAQENQEILIDGYDFSDNSVLVTMEKDVGGVNKIHDKSYFGNIAVTAVTDLTYRENVANVDLDRFKQILKLELQYHDKSYVLQAVEEIGKLKGVEMVTPNYFGEFCATANDAFYSSQWGLNEVNGINIEPAWDITTGSKTIRVGVIDSGISRHPDLNDNRAIGKSFVSGDIGTEDTYGHGTHVAGIIGAVGDNHIGISGVCKTVELVPLRVGNESWGTENIIKAINYANELWGTDKQIDILNFSGWNGPNWKTFSDAINSYNGLFVTIAGNGEKDANDVSHGYDIDANPNYPGSFTCDNIITVGSIDFNGSRSEFSNYGKNSVDIYAPGENIYSTYTNNTYAYMSGTSMAAPHVTGVAALLLSKNPTLSAAELKQLILDGADEIPISIPGVPVPQEVKKLNAYNALHLLPYKVTFDKQGGQGGDDFVYATYGEKMPAATAPTREGYEFAGYYYYINGLMYYDKDMKSVGVWNIKQDTTLYAKWNKCEYTVTFKIEGDTTGEYTFTVKLNTGDKWPKINMPTRPGYYVGDYWDAETDRAYYYSFDGGRPRYETFTRNKDMELVGTWIPNSYYLLISNKHSNVDKATRTATYIVTHDETITFTANESMTSGSNDTKLFSYWSVIQDEVNYDPITNPWIKISTERTITVNIAEIVEKYYPYLEDDGILELRATYAKTPPKDNSCVAEGTLITLANGEQVPVERLTGDEMLLVWNLYTGTFDTAPILFIDHDDEGMYEVIKLSFSDGTTVEVIYEHAFWDFNLNKYVFLRSDADQYLGHWFNKQIIDEDGQMAWSKVQLTDVQVQQKYTSSWSPVTYGHLCYYVNGMLSMPGATEGLINIFEVDSQTMKYDEEKMLEYINEFGLFTYEEFAEILPVPEEIFNAFSGQYLKVAIGKGLVDFETLASLTERYQEFF